MLEAWFKEELETAELGDKRSNERFESILEALTARPNASIPASMGGRTELEPLIVFSTMKK